MGENTKIEWAHHTFNGWIGCTKVGTGCDNCYAADLSQARLGVPWGAGQPRRHTAASTWKLPRRWNNRAAKEGVRYRVFCSSLADVFDNEVPAEWRAELFQLIRETPHLDWLLVTKRIGNVRKMVEAACGMEGLPKNVWLGITVVTQAEADRDVPKLREIQASIRFLSMEPLLERVDISGFLRERAIDWVIVGGESGPNARPMNKDWAVLLRDQCANEGVPFLFKQWGEWFAYGEIDADGLQNTRTLGEALGKWFAKWESGPPAVRIGKKQAGRYLDGRTHDGVPTVSTW